MPWHHVYLTSPDRETSAAWYQQYLGLHLGVDDPEAVAHWYARNLDGQVTACPFDQTRLQVSYDTAR